MILSNSVSLFSYLDESSTLDLEDVISSNINLEEELIDYESYKKLFLYKHNFKFEESLIYELKINKFSNKEIACLLDIPYKGFLHSIFSIACVSKSNQAEAKEHVSIGINCFFYSISRPNRCMFHVLLPPFTYNTHKTLIWSIIFKNFYDF